MKKLEFLRELEIALEGTMPQDDIRMILESYETMFYNGFLDGKEEEILTEEMGSPARIVKNILTVYEEEEKEEQEEDAVAQALTQRFFETNPAVFAMSLASMKSRLAAYLIDSVIVTVCLSVLATVLMTLHALIEVLTGSVSGYTYNSAYYYAFNIGSVTGLLSPLLLSIVLGTVNIVTAFFLWRTNGYTPGKRLMHIRVRTLSGEKMTLKNALLRDAGVKFLLNGLTTGFLNVVSAVWGIVTIDRKTVHDAVAKTTVVSDFTKEELKAMAADRKVARSKRIEKNRERTEQRRAEKEKLKADRKKRKQEKLIEVGTKSLKKKEAKAEARKNILLEEERKRVEKARAKEEAKKRAAEEAALKKQQSTAEERVDTARYAQEFGSDGAKSDAPELGQQRTSLNEKELAEIKRIRENLELQRKMAEEALMKDRKSKGPTIIYKDHEKN